MLCVASPGNPHPSDLRGGPPQQINCSFCASASTMIACEIQSRVGTPEALNAAMGPVLVCALSVPWADGVAFGLGDEQGRLHLQSCGQSAATPVERRWRRRAPAPVEVRLHGMGLCRVAFAPEQRVVSGERWDRRPHSDANCMHVSLALSACAC